MIQPQFARGEVDKVYLARRQGHPRADSFGCAAPISTTAGLAGSRYVNPRGLPAHTDFRVRARYADGTALLEVRPHTGRTNQIRVHLWHRGFSVCGDESYLPGGKFLPGGKLGATQTLRVDCGAVVLTCLADCFSSSAAARGRQIRRTVEPLGGGCVDGVSA